MKKANGVKVSRVDHCEKCRCKSCTRPIVDLKTYRSHIKCPFKEKPCACCGKIEFVEECIFCQTEFEESLADELLEDAGQAI